MLEKHALGCRITFWWLLLSASIGGSLTALLLCGVQDLDLPPEMVAEARAAPGQESQFVAPTPGVTPSQRWLQKCSLAADHVAAGDFASAMRLLNRYLPVLTDLQHTLPVSSH